MSRMEIAGPEGKHEGGNGREEQRGKKPKAGTLWWRPGCKDSEFLALEERAGCSRAVSLLMPLKDPSGLCCCLRKGRAAFLLLCLFPLMVRQEPHLSSPRPFCQLLTPNKLIRINVGDLDKGGFLKPGLGWSALLLSPRAGATSPEPRVPRVTSQGRGDTMLWTQVVPWLLCGSRNW